MPVEDSTMDKAKKNVKLIPPSGKSNLDQKQKLAVIQEFGQNARAVRNRKPVPWQPPVRRSQKCRQPPDGRRSRQRHNGTAAVAQCGGRGQVGDDVELGSVYHKGSKKGYQDASYLVNFRFESARDAHVERYSGSQWRQLRTSRGFERSNASRHYRPKHVKEQYLQARCQFVVREDAGLAVNYADPDALVDWTCVEQVWLHEDRAASCCPICLYPPTAARITRCGHVYCWACLLHYLALSDQLARKCPICEQPVQAGQLRSCRLLTRQLAADGDSLTFRLMRRDRYSLQAQPVDAFGRPWQEYVRFDDASEKQQLAKLILTSPQQVLSCIVQPEREQLQLQLVQLLGEPELCFVEQALEMLVVKEEEVADWQRLLLQRPRRPSETVEVADLPAAENTGDGAGELVEDVEDSLGDTIVYESAFDDQRFGEAGDDADSEAVVEGAGARKRSTSETSACDVTAADLEVPVHTAGEQADSALQDKPFYFYQVDGGQPIYLHALNCRMLLEEFGGDWERCPARVSAVVVDVDAVTMTEPFRQRLRNLRHLPLAAQLQVVEVRLQPPLVSQQTLAMFKDQLKKREVRRREKLRRERQLERRIWQQENRHHTAGQLLEEPVGDSVERPPTPPDQPVTGDGVETAGGPSFAQLLRAAGGGGGGKSVGAWVSAPRPRPAAGGVLVEPLEEGAAPSFSDSWSADLAAALERLDKPEDAAGNVVAGGSKGRKKGKKGRIVLSSGLPF